MLRKISQFSILPACRESCTSESLVLFKIRKHVQGVHPLIYTIKTKRNLFFPTRIWDRNQVANTRSVELSSIKNHDERKVFLKLLQIFQAISAPLLIPG